MFRGLQDMARKIKKKSRSSLVTELDRVFSIFIRTRNVNAEGITKCFTCGKTAHWKELQCGHFISRRHYSTRWDEKNCQPQCSRCNIFNQGNAPVFAQRLIAKYGSDILDLLIAKKNNTFKASNFELEVLISEYK